MKFKGLRFPSFSDQRTPAPRRQWIAHAGARARARNSRNAATKDAATMSKGLDAATGMPIVGQPFIFTNGTVPVTGQLTCNCQIPGTTMQVIASAPVTCPKCQKTLIAMLPMPQGSQVLIVQVLPDSEKKAS